MTQYSLIIAGSTIHTQMCAEALMADKRFTIAAVITPPPKPVGRKQELITNPLHQFALDHQLPVIHVEQRLDAQLRHQVEAICLPLPDHRPDFVVVVDFGYIVPNWLLALPKVAPVNVHPSALPRWRGSSPGQFVLLYGEKNSAVTVMTMNAGLDTGDIITQLPLPVTDGWTQTEYYHQAFTLVSPQLPQILDQVAQKDLVPIPQPEVSPTPIASRFTKEDGFVPWELVQLAMKSHSGVSDDSEVLATAPLSPILSNALGHHTSLASLLHAATAALSPWPGVWTQIPTAKGEKRMKILSTQLLQPTQLQLQQVQIEGKAPTSWNEVKNVAILE